MKILNPCAAVDVTADAANLTPPLIVGSMLIVQTEVMAAFPALEAYRVASPDPLPQDPGPNGVFIQAASRDWFEAAAPADPENPWSLFIEV